MLSNKVLSAVFPADDSCVIRTSQRYILPEEVPPAQYLPAVSVVIHESFSGRTMRIYICSCNLGQRPLVLRDVEVAYLLEVIDIQNGFVRLDGEYQSAQAGRSLNDCCRMGGGRSLLEACELGAALYVVKSDTPCTKCCHSRCRRATYHLP